MGNPVVHFEIAGRDGEKLEEFYTRLFGWNIQRRTVGRNPYGFVRTGDDGRIDGGIRHDPEGDAEIVLYVEVRDLATAVASAEELGAKIRIPPRVAEDVTFAMIIDPGGNPVGLIQKKK